MLQGYITRTSGINPSWEIAVDGLRALRYMDATKAQAIAHYRKSFGLVGRHINWRDYTLPSEPKNLMDAVMAYLRTCEH